jgi:hypothetical protein
MHEIWHDDGVDIAHDEQSTVMKQAVERLSDYNGTSTTTHSCASGRALLGTSSADKTLQP